MHESNNNFIEIEANTRIENNEEDNLSQTIALKNEESDSDEFNREQVELAKKTRENQRRISSGDYIPLQNRDKDFFEKSEKERIYMSGVKKEEDRIKKEFLEEEKTQKKKKFQSHFAEDEEDDEFQRYEKKLINKVIKKSMIYNGFLEIKFISIQENVIQNVIANQDQLLDDQKGKFNNSTQFIPIKKQQFNFENISYDYINSFLEENCKTIEKNIESTKQKIEKVIL